MPRPSPESTNTSSLILYPSHAKHSLPVHVSATPPDAHSRSPASPQPKSAIVLQFGRRIHDGIGMELCLVERPVHVGRGFFHQRSIFLCPSSSAHDKEADDDCDEKEANDAAGDRSGDPYRAFFRAAYFG